jgi:RimJ/RimL family protein N-acetyltransferase
LGYLELHATTKGDNKMGRMSTVKHIIDGKSLILRHGEVSDAEELVELMGRLNAETTFLLREPDEFDVTIAQEEEFIQYQQDSEVNLFIVAEFDGRLVGTCGIMGSTRRRLRHTAKLAIAIEKNCWGLGIGKRLMEAGIQWAKENAVSRIALEVDTNNYRAIGLYLKMGFIVEGTLKNDKLMADGSYRSAYTMALLS